MVAETVSWPTVNGARADDSDRIALYLRLSRIFRQRITSGAWGHGTRLPTITELCQEYQVAAITVRQALRLLSDDGLIVSRRGKGTFVTAGKVPSRSNSPASASDLHTPLADARIKVIDRARSVALPGDLSSDKDEASYVRVTKIHYSRNTPFVLVSIFVASRAFERFPPGADQSRRISDLFREYSGIPVARDRQVFTISYADQVSAKHLGCSLGSVLIQMRSWWFDDHERVVFAGTFLYRGDMFMLERGSLRPSQGLLPTAVEPHAPGNRRRTRADRAARAKAS